MFLANEIERSRYHRWYSDFEAVTAQGIVFAAAGAGAQNTSVAPQTQDQVGVAKHEMGTTATGSAGWSTAPATLRMDALARIKMEMSIRSGAALSDGVDTSTIRAGFLDAVTVEPVDGVYFRYSSGLSAGFWQCVTRANNVETVVATTIAYAINTTYILQIEVLPDATKVFFNINGVNVASQTLTIPVGAGRETGWGAFALKSLGTANKGEFYTDYCDVVVIYR